MAGFLAGAQVVGNIYSGYSAIENAKIEADAIKKQGEFQKKMFVINTKMAEANYKDSIRRGEDAATQVKKDAKRIIGAQRASMAAQGIEIDSGTALELQGETAELAAQDAMKIKVNAMREAYGYKIEAINATLSGKMAESTARSRSAMTLATGGLQAINYGVGAAGGLANYLRG